MIVIRERLNPVKVLGKAIKVYLRSGGAFNFKVVAAGIDCIGGYDEDGLDIHINTNDIDFIIE